MPTGDPAPAPATGPPAGATPAPPAPTRRQHALGVALFLAVACIWVISAELIQYIFTDSFDSPFFLTYYSTSLFSLYLFGFCGSSWRSAFQPAAAYQLLTGLAQPDAPRPAPSPGRRALRLALLLGPLFFLLNWTFNVGLEHTSVSSASTIATLTTLFTLILAALTGIEKFSVPKFFATAMSIAGVALISYSDKRQAGSDHLSGDLISIVSAAFYALYSVVLKHQSNLDPSMCVMMMFAFMGLFTFISAWPAFFVLHFSGWEPFKLPNPYTLMMLTLNGIIGTVLSDYLWAKGVVFTTPVTGTLALSLSVPLSIIADLLMGRQAFDFVYLVAVALVFLGFIIATVAKSTDEEEATRPHSPTTEVSNA